jgi:hypothetical protein
LHCIVVPYLMALLLHLAHYYLQQAKHLIILKRLVQAFCLFGISKVLGFIAEVFFKIVIMHFYFFFKGCEGIFSKTKMHEKGSKKSIKVLKKKV